MSSYVDENTKKLLEEFERMLEEDSSPFKYPLLEDLEYPDSEEPPPIPEEVECKHLEKEKVIISNNLKYWLCKKCKKDLGDVE